MCAGLIGLLDGNELSGECRDLEIASFGLGNHCLLLNGELFLEAGDAVVSVGQVGDAR